MTYRATLIERSRQHASDNDEPEVLDYLQQRNRECLYEWRMKQVRYALHSVKQASSNAAGAQPTVA